MLFKISKNVYGLHLTIKLFGFNLWIRCHKDYLTAKTLGIRNNTPDGKRVPFFDFDNHLLEHLIPELKYLQRKHRLSDLYIFRSSQKPNSYHVIGLDKLDFRHFLNILGETTCDQFYKDMPVTNDWKGWVLRIIPKEDSVAPKLIMRLKSKYQDRPKSRPHWLFLKYHHGIKNTPKKLDKNYELYTTFYDTLNFLTKKLVKKEKSI